MAAGFNCNWFARSARGEARKCVASARRLAREFGDEILTLEVGICKFMKWISAQTKCRLSLIDES